MEPTTAATAPFTPSLAFTLPWQGAGFLSPALPSQSEVLPFTLRLPSELGDTAGQGCESRSSEDTDFRASVRHQALGMWEGRAETSSGRLVVSGYFTRPWPSLTSSYLGWSLRSKPSCLFPCPRRLFWLQQLWGVGVYRQHPRDHWCCCCQASCCGCL